MECLIPLSVLAKLAKYGVKKYKPYNDAKGLLKEKYGLEVVEDEAIGKAIRVESEEDWLRFFDYFVQELLGKAVEERNKIVYEGVPLERYESCLYQVSDLKERLATETEKRKELEKEIDALKLQLHERERELNELGKTVKEKEKEIEECRKELKQLKLQPILKELEEKVGKEKVQEMLKVLLSEDQLWR